jgi:hypothetical protein
MIGQIVRVFTAHSRGEQQYHNQIGRVVGTSRPFRSGHPEYERLTGSVTVRMADGSLVTVPEGTVTFQ